MDLLIRLRERGRRGGDLAATPTLPTDASAADLLQRRCVRMVSPFTTVGKIYIMSTVDLVLRGICQ